ncbi:MAG: ArsC/Spx/MgsR family protein [Myxococcota bacterium]|nr:ArsC/Spx/MgsR family protein [Myxococcota bacterium]
MLKEHQIPFTYREYKKDTLTADEIRAVLGKLGMTVRDVLRKRDAGKLGLTGEESDDALIDLMAVHPGLLQRPIGIIGDRAALGRPVENLLTLTSD